MMAGIDHEDAAATATASRSPLTGMTIAVFSPVNTTATDNSPFCGSRAVHILF